MCKDYQNPLFPREIYLLSCDKEYRFTKVQDNLHIFLFKMEKKKKGFQVCFPSVTQRGYWYKADNLKQTCV